VREESERGLAEKLETERTIAGVGDEVACGYRSRHTRINVYVMWMMIAISR